MTDKEKAQKRFEASGKGLIIEYPKPKKAKPKKAKAGKGKK